MFLKDCLPHFHPKETWTEGIYIIDESSMLQNEHDDAIIDSASMIATIIKLIKASNSSKVVFLGDQFQLLPVGEKYSVAMDPIELEKQYDIQVLHADLNTIFRQDANSGILQPATQVRNSSDIWTIDNFAPTSDVAFVSRKDLMGRLKLEIEQNVQIS